jgi:hypothetical protein
MVFAPRRLAPSCSILGTAISSFAFQCAKANAADEAEIANLKKQAQVQQAAIKQLLVQVQSIQQTVVSRRSAHLHPRVASTAATKTTKPEAKHDASRPAASPVLAGK